MSDSPLRDPLPTRSGSLSGRIRQQWRDWHEITTNDEPIIRWVPWPWNHRPWAKKNTWPQIDLWVTPDCFLGFTLGSASESGKYRTSALTVTFAYLSLIFSVEHWEEK